ncbi:MAG: hypothetical protein H6624_14620 [Bdellovibrionaceae bacterium]|nr:hypothetical protein [Bdellovibrionales bacterium]MCB9085577.1 hypothetical protein [Pseudobdellovibrionaceae bacterium]
MFWFRVSIYLFCLSLTVPVWAELSTIQIDGPLAAQPQQHEMILIAMAPAATEPATTSVVGATGTADAPKDEVIEPVIEEQEEDMALTAIFTDYEKAAAEKAELLEESPFEESDGIIVRSEQGEILLEEAQESSL